MYKYITWTEVPECVSPHQWRSIGLLGPKTIPFETVEIEISDHEYNIHY